MSYDFRLFVAQPGVDPLETAQSEADEECEEINPGPLVTAKEVRKRTIADALLKANSDLTVFQFGFEEIAKSQSISVDEVKLRFRHIELNGPDDGPGIQIVLFDDGASLTVPYWHKDQKAKTVFAQIWECLTVIQHVGGYQIYDPQLERIVHLASDLEKVTGRYSDVMKRVMGLAGNDQEGKHPWWKFW
jgi:hypothetical protein